MSKVKYNVKGVERGGGNYKQPTPGLYDMEIKEANLRDSDGKNDIEVILEVIEEGEFKGSRLWTYVGLGEASQWKMAELVDALGLPETGELDTKKMIGKQLKVKVNADTYNNEYRARAGRLAPLNSEVGEDTPEADPDDPDAATGDHVVVELNDVELSTDPEYYSDWEDSEVLEEVENQKLALKGAAKKNREKVIEALIELAREHGGGGDGGDTPDEPAAGDDEPDQYDDEDVWSDKDLAAEYKRRALDTITGKKDRAKVIAALRADDAGGDDDDPFAD